MKRRKTGLFLAAVLVGCACNLSTARTPAPEGEPAGTADATETVPNPTSEPAAVETPTATIPPGFFPIAVGSGYQPGEAILLGGTENGAWMDAETAAARMFGGETYTLYMPDGPTGTVVGSKPVRDKICPQYSLNWSPAPSATALIGLGGTWNPLPRVPEAPAVSDFPIYTKAAGEWLAAQGMPVPDPLRLTNVVRADLDGDGSIEAVISATRLSDDTGHDVAAGDFSFVLLHREAAAETILLSGDVYPAAQSIVFPSAYSLLSILDLNVDGRMEVLVHISLFEGGGTRVFSFDGAAAESVLYTKCSL
jgi:hypothetical protein